MRVLTFENATAPKTNDLSLSIIERADDTVIERLVPLGIQEPKVLQTGPLRGGKLG